MAYEKLITAFILDTKSLPLILAMSYEHLIVILIWLIVWLAFPVCGYFGWYYYNKSRHEERKLLIAQGKNPDEFLKPRKPFRFPWLKIAAVIVSFGIGLFIISLLINFHWVGQSDAIYPAILCICSGGGLLIANYIDNRQKPE